MATMKRRVIYASDEEWAKWSQEAAEHGLTTSLLIRRTMEAWYEMVPTFDREIEILRSGSVTLRPVTPSQKGK